jgi:hypothetical protein
MPNLVTFDQLNRSGLLFQIGASLGDDRAIADDFRSDEFTELPRFHRIHLGAKFARRGWLSFVVFFCWPQTAAMRVIPADRNFRLQQHRC